jgi:hypothetical protein
MTILAIMAFCNTSYCFIYILQISDMYFGHFNIFKKLQVSHMFLCAGGMFEMREGIPVLTDVLTDSTQASSPLSVNI